MCVTLKFKCLFDDTTIEIEANQLRNYIYIQVTNPEDDLINLGLNKSTAIKLSKELRKQIALID